MIAVLMGGYSAERDISLLSGNAVYESLVKSNIKSVSYTHLTLPTILLV